MHVHIQDFVLQLVQDYLQEHLPVLVLQLLTMHETYIILELVHT